MCEHKNLRTVGDRLFCKDCKTELPIEFLTKGQEEEKADAVIDAAAVEIKPAEVMEEQTVVEPAAADPVEETIQEAPQGEQEQGENAPVSEEPAEVAPKKQRAKTGKKTAKKGE